MASSKPRWKLSFKRRCPIVSNSMQCRIRSEGLVRRIWPLWKSKTYTCIHLEVRGPHDVALHEHTFYGFVLFGKIRGAREILT
jgi:hypothetical protein